MSMTLKDIQTRQTRSYFIIDRHSFDTIASCRFVMGEYNRYIDECVKKGYHNGYRYGLGAAEHCKRQRKDASAPLPEYILADRAETAGKTIAGEQGKLAALDTVPEAFEPEYREAVGVMAWTSAAMAWVDGYRDGVALVNQ